MNKTQKTYEILLNDILLGKLYQGQKLVENDLMQSYNIGKTPLREALIQLEKIGLVEREFNRGFIIRHIGRKDAEEIYDLREVLERLAVQKTIENIDEGKIQKLSQIIDKMTYHVNNKNMDEYSKLDMYFHLLLCELSDNERLLNIIKNLQYQIRLLLKTSIKLPERGIEKSFNEHQELYNAILSKDVNRAEVAIKKHIKKAKEAVLHYLGAFVSY
jgi:DNA-binding GntR family transcriptional regulator